MDGTITLTSPAATCGDTITASTSNYNDTTNTSDLVENLLGESGTTSKTSMQKLPATLRLQIWNLLLPGPRIVQLSFKKYKKGDPRLIDSDSEGDTNRLGSRTPVPIGLHICAESRAETLKTYHLQFGCSLYQPNVYFNFDLDTLCFGTTRFSRHNPEHRSQWFRDYAYGSSGSYFRQLGDGYHELEFFWQHLATAEVVESLRSIAYYDGWNMRFEIPAFLAPFSRLTHLTRLTCYYSRTTFKRWDCKQSDVSLCWLAGRADAEIKRNFDHFQDENPAWNYPSFAFVFALEEEEAEG